MRLVLLAAMAAIALQPASPAQTRLNARPGSCKGTGPFVYAEVPARIGERAVLIPMCLALGSGFTIDTATDPPTLHAAPAHKPWLAVERLDLGTLSLEPGQPELTVTLPNTPVEGSAVLAFYHGYRVPRIALDVRPAQTGRGVIVTLPGWVPYYPGEDLISLVYLTLDPRK